MSEKISHLVKKQPDLNNTYMEGAAEALNSLLNEQGFDIPTGFIMLLYFNKWLVSTKQVRFYRLAGLDPAEFSKDDIIITYPKNQVVMSSKSKGFTMSFMQREIFNDYARFLRSQPKTE